jgi:DOPA 4,5-dioxygenase
VSEGKFKVIARQEFSMDQNLAPTTVPPVRDPAIIRHYHAHIYYDPASRDRAALLRERMAAQFPDAVIGRWHDEPVGPHPQSMYQVAFPTTLLASILPWLMLNRDDLTILVHPGTDNGYADHTKHAVWLGGILPVRLNVFRNAPKSE